MDIRVTEIDIPAESNRKFGEYYNGRYSRLPEKDTPSGKSRVYVHVEGETMWDDFGNRTSRPHTLWRGPILAALKEAGFPENTRLRWSQKAGCSCPCSPAFFVTSTDPRGRGRDIWATITADAPQVEDVELAQARQAQLAVQL